MAFYLSSQSVMITYRTASADRQKKNPKSAALLGSRQQERARSEPNRDGDGDGDGKNSILRDLQPIQQWVFDRFIASLILFFVC